jgi:hypothetical protein
VYISENIEQDSRKAFSDFLSLPLEGAGSFTIESVNLLYEAKINTARHREAIEWLLRFCNEGQNAADDHRL